MSYSGFITKELKGQITIDYEYQIINGRFVKIKDYKKEALLKLIQQSINEFKSRLK